MEVLSQKSYNILNILSNLFALTFSSIIIIRWWYYIYTYSVNILFWDQWDFYNALFERHNLWELFRWQHGPHRQGVGFILTKFFAELSGWNTRFEAFVIGGIMCLAMVCALSLKRRLILNLSWTDVVIPLIFLTPSQYDIFVNTPNLSHGSVPLLLLILYCYAWTLKYSIFRYILVLLLNFLLIYTGFGVFIGIITPAMLSIEYFYINKTSSKKEPILLFISIFIALLSIGSFFIGYRFSPAVPNFEFPVPQYWIKYPLFFAVTLANFCGLKSVPFFIIISVGFIILFIMIGIGMFHLKRLLVLSFIPLQRAYREINLSQVIVILISFSLIFCISTAIGRISLGLDAGKASRYITYLIPGFFGIYLHLANITREKKRNLLLFTAVVCLILANYPLRKSDFQNILMYSNGKTQWMNFYLQTEDIEKTNKTIGFKIYPNAEVTNLKQKLDYLKARKLNLYLDYSKSCQ